MLSIAYRITNYDELGLKCQYDDPSFYQISILQIFFNGMFGRIICLYFTHISFELE
jgi:hypothetical protein